MRISLIVAMAHDRVIGRDNALPWHLSEDLRFFKSTTMGKPMVMGRKTWDSIGRPLPGRTSIVLSSRESPALAPNVLHARSVDEALDSARAVARRDGVDEVMVIGGEAVYRAVLPCCDRIYLTEIDLEIAGYAFFPPLEPAAWSSSVLLDWSFGADSGLRFRVMQLDRVALKADRASV